MTAAHRLVEEGTRRLAAASVPEADVKCQWWAAEVLGVRRDRLGDAQATPEQARRFTEGIERLAAHEPLQYVIGHTPFHGLDVLTDRRALIPRPETEELVALVLACRDLRATPAPVIADVGTGTGCIALALAAARPDARILAIDASSDALALARASAERLGLGDRIEFREGDLLTGVAAGSLDTVVSNPPYIASGVIPTLEASVYRFEPVQALDGGPDGLDVIRRLVHQAFTALANGGRVWLEIGDDQGAPVQALLAQAGFHHVGIRRDMYGQVRFAEGLK